MSSKEDFEKQQDKAVREIIRVEALAGEWLPIPDEFHSGSEIGFDVADVSVRAIVMFDKYEVTVIMTSPMESICHKEIYYRQQTFFRRNPPGASLFVNGVDGGPAIPRCIETARDLLIGLYTDWVILRSRRETIRRKIAAFTEYASSFLENEKARIVPIKDRIRALSIESGLLKRKFKTGEMSQGEYVEKKRPVHEEIVSLMDQSHVRDPFRIYFSEELDDCQYAMNKRELIESI